VCPKNTQVMEFEGPSHHHLATNHLHTSSVLSTNNMTFLPRLRHLLVFIVFYAIIESSYVFRRSTSIPHNVENVAHDPPEKEENTSSPEETLETKYSDNTTTLSERGSFNENLEKSKYLPQYYSNATVRSTKQGRPEETLEKTKYSSLYPSNITALSELGPPEGSRDQGASLNASGTANDPPKKEGNSSFPAESHEKTKSSPLYSSNNTEETLEKTKWAPLYSNNFTAISERGLHFLTTLSGCNMAAWVYAAAPLEQNPILRDCLTQPSAPRVTSVDEQRQQIRRHDTVYVVFTRLDHFATYFLPNLTQPIVVISGQQQNGWPTRNETARRILEHPLVLHWFCQNLDRFGGYDPNHPKVSKVDHGSKDRKSSTSLTNTAAMPLLKNNNISVEPISLWLETESY